MMNKKNKEYYQRVYDSVNASSELKERLTDMEERNKMTEKHSKKKGIKMAGKVAVAVAAVSLAVPTGAYAYERISDYFKMEVEQNGYQVDMEVKKTDSSSAKKDTISAKEDVKPVKLVYDSIEGYTQGLKTGGGWYEFATKEGFKSGKEFSVEVLQVDVDTSKEYFVDDVTYSQNITVNGNKGIYIQKNDVVGSKYNEDTAYTQRVVVFYEDMGYIMHFYAQSGIKKEQLIKYANQITIENCEKQEEIEVAYLSEQLQNTDVVKEEIEWVKQEQLVNVKETMVYDGMEYEVLKVDVKDNISKEMKDIAKELGHNEDDVSVYAKKDGTLKTYDRETITVGDGKNTPSGEVSKTENIGQKFVLVTLRVKNTTKKAVEKQVCRDLVYFTEQDGKIKVDNTEYGRPNAITEVKGYDSMPCYFKETDGGKEFYIKKLKAGEEAVYHIGYMVDEDQLSQMALRIDDGSGSSDKTAKYINIKN
ncbi:MAG: hypothetical protein HDT30_07940 [Clostridiales bacterium]|nr:hypothetical protein [Clostridiales bacterium]